MAVLLNGKETSEKMRAEMKTEIAALKERGLIPGLAVILIGDNPPSVSYVKGKEKACEEIGIMSRVYRFDKTYKEDDLLRLITGLNGEPAIHGILVQVPLPAHINEEKVLNAISPDKDVDGFHPVNIGKMMIGADCFLPCTPHGIQQLILRNGIEISGRHVVIVGRSNIVGKPLAMILIQKKAGANATVTICHTGTRDLAEYTRRADILVLAAGKPDTVTADMIKEGAAVILVGQNWLEDKTKKSGFRVIGDADFDELSKKAGAITPVLGGVGPMTITMLLFNTLASAKKHAGR